MTLVEPTGVRYTTSLDGVTPEALEGGFFEGWAAPPTPGDHLRLLRQSAHAVVALEGTAVIGFVTAVSDGVLAAYIPLLEVLPHHRGKGVGTALVQRLLHAVASLYMVDVVCDDGVLPFYERLGFSRTAGAVIRNYRWREATQE